jgi:rubredoxin
MKEFDMELIKRFIKQYIKGRKKEKTEILTQYLAIVPIKRDTAQKRFRRFIKRMFKNEINENNKSAKGRKPKYNALHKQIVKKCWELSGNICGERLYPIMERCIEDLNEKGELKDYPAKIIEETKQISLGTLKRIIKEFPLPLQKRKPKGNAFIYRQIPITADFGKNAYAKPGYIEVDFIEHNGGNSQGIFAITGVYTDLSTQWTVRACGLGKNLNSVSEIDKIAHSKIPFEVLHYHPDNDKTILRVLFDRVRKNGAMISRSRPYKKNDNAHVEQKGGDKVRKLVGYLRFDTEEEVKLLNELYAIADIFENFFIPCVKLKAKIKDEKGRIIKKVYEKPKTPYQRILESNEIPEETKRKLTNIYKTLNMVKLKQKMNMIMEKLMKIKSISQKGRKNFTDKIMIYPLKNFTDTHF